MIFIMSNEYTKKISNHLLITVSRFTCNSLFASSIFCPLLSSRCCSILLALFYHFYLCFTPSLTVFFSLLLPISLIRLDSFAIRSLIITFYVMIYVQKNARLLSNETIILITDHRDWIHFLRYLHSHRQLCWSSLFCVQRLNEMFP